MKALAMVYIRSLRIYWFYRYLIIITILHLFVGLPIIDLVTNILLHGSNKRVNEITDCNNRGKRPNTRTFILISNAMLQNLMYKQISHGLNSR